MHLCSSMHSTKSAMRFLNAMNIFQKLYCFVQTTTYKKNEQTLSEDDESYTQVKFKKPMSQYYFDNDGGYLMAFFFALLVAELS